MNKRFKELAQQVDAGYIPRYDMWQMDSETVQKFAELIVQECADIVGNYQDKATYYRASEKLQEHFGVEL